jgi:hypothetical protein
VRLLPFLIEAKARARQRTERLEFDEAFKQEFRKAFNQYNDLEASNALPWFGRRESYERSETAHTRQTRINFI